MRFVPIAAALAVAASLFAGSASALDETGKGAPGGAKDWASHKGNIPFIVGREAGAKEAEFTGKPILYFYTATW